MDNIVDRYFPVLDALTEAPTDWVARLAPAQSHGWQIYADFLLSAGHSRIALAAESSVSSVTFSIGS